MRNKFQPQIFPILPSENEKVKKFIYKLKITNFQLNILATWEKKKLNHGPCGEERKNGVNLNH